MLAYCSVLQVTGQFTARNADGKVATQYSYANGKCDTIFIFNQTPEKKNGNLSLQKSELCTFKWYRFNDNDKKFVLFDELTDVMETSKYNLEEGGGYKLTVTYQGETAPRDSFVAWLFLNPEFNFSLYKNVIGEVLEFGYKFCTFTNFRINSITEPSSFTYYNPVSLEQCILANEIVKYTMQPENGEEIQIRPEMLDNILYLRDYNPPRKDTRYTFRVYDKFDGMANDEIMYRTILPDATINPPVLPDTDPTSAPVHVEFSSNPNNITLQNYEYIWRFGNGDSIVFDPDRPPPDVVQYTFYTPNTQGYKVTLVVTSRWECVHETDAVIIRVSPPSLDVPNVFTPNNDQLNDYFKPNAVSLRQFEIWIYSRTGKRVYYYRGDDLRDWQGWDGRIENTGKEAAEGVYFYIIKAIGWDEPPTKKPQAGPYSGSVHLYR